MYCYRNFFFVYVFEKDVQRIKIIKYLFVLSYMFNLFLYLLGSGYWKILNDKLRNLGLCLFVYFFIYKMFNEYFLYIRYF